MTNADPYALEAYDYVLPEELIAQEPADERDQSRLLVLDQGGGDVHHGRFTDILSLLDEGDVLVVNDTRVFPARLLGAKETGGRVEFLLLGYPATAGALPGPSGWREVEARGLLKSSKGARPGQGLRFSDDLTATVLEVLEGGKARVTLSFRGELGQRLEECGRIPLPPYIRRAGSPSARDRQRYQTVFANQTGAVAAPTAGLHFSPELLERIRAMGVDVAMVTLHVGYGTFAPVRSKDIRDHQIHAEYVSVGAAAAARINRARAAGRAVWPVGTTSVRSLEWASDSQGRVRPREGWCALYIYPGYEFRLVDRLITNFHLPKSSLLFLVSALAGRERVMQAYAAAVRERYRFFSYGDAMVVAGKS